MYGRIFSAMMSMAEWPVHIETKSVLHEDKADASSKRKQGRRGRKGGARRCSCDSRG